ncbi:MAG: acetyl-CoA carboxylase biotin carboxyl carrier protein subunit [Rhodospirillaceae bacterium]|mgnify:CR=1 FL=1|nr:acetyl-CoA carboxylase biotin carboxyl carrier protein subunit [Rhodospirillaceae bacterium]|tara:strand:- start:1950 stop:2399 length:450 start_codon:yes stop_codon:yes gene_type:complete
MAEFDVNEEMVRKLAELLDETGLTEIEYKLGDHAVRVSRNASGQMVASAPIAAAPAPATAAESSPAAASGPRSGAVTAPMVGVVYLSPEPGSPTFVKPGDTVSEGQTLLLIEAMKTFNPVRAPSAGRVVEICIPDKSPVEFGEELVILE